MPINRIVIAACLWLMFLAIPALAGDNVIVSLKTTACPWADIHLEDRLDLHLASINRIPVVRQDLPANSDNLAFEDLLDWGQQRDGHFLVDIAVERIDLDLRKVTVFPFLLYRYRAYAVLSGHLRVIDLDKKRQLVFKEIAYDIKASDQWQPGEDNKFDPALNIPADEKRQLFRRLEEKVAEELSREIKALTRGNHFGS
nr:hypothetical protein [candidate division Zixibacteria bacterium]